MDIKNSVALIQKQIIPLVEKAKVFVIKDGKDMEEATVMLSTMNKIGDKIKAEKKTIIDPAKAIIKREEERWAPVEGPYKEGISIIRSTISLYQTEQDRIAQQKEKDIAARVGEGKGKLRAETAVAKIGEIDRPQSTIATNAGILKFRSDKKLRITDIKKVPREYLVPDETRILADLKEGKKIAGCEIEIIKTPINIR